MKEIVKVCTKCSTINDASANFCRICGEKLSDEVSETTSTLEQQPTALKQEPTNYSQQAEYDQNPQFNEDISDAEMSAYIGIKAPIFLQKFKVMEITHSKTGFNVLILLLGLLISPIAASFWFFHRKMNKIGAIIFSIGIVLSACSFAISAPMINNISDGFKSIFEEQQNQSNDGFYYDYNSNDGYSNNAPSFSTEKQLEFVENLSRNIMAIYPFLLLISFAGAATTIVASIKANYWYKESAVKRIKEIKNLPNHDISAIATAGGTNALPWVILLIFWIVIQISVYAILFTHMLTTIIAVILQSNIY